MKKIGGIIFWILVFLDLLVISAIVYFTMVLKDLYYDFGIIGILMGAGISIISAFHFFVVFPRKYKQIFPPSSPSSQKFALHSPQSRFQEQNPILYTVLILSAILFAYILFFSSSLWLSSHYDASRESDQYDNYETEPEFWMDMNDTVYISSTGKIHLSPDCSGMKAYDEMTYEDACEAGYEHCSRCFN